MKPQEQRQEFIRLRAEGYSFRKIADQLHISKSTCSAWDKELGEDIAKLKSEAMDELYQSYGMTKEARIKKIGDTLGRIDTALAEADLSEVPPEKLLDYKLKYTEALSKEYVSTAPAFKPESIQPKDIVIALGDLLDRVRAGEVSTEQASRESLILSNLLKAYDEVEVKTKLDALETVLGGR